MDIKSLDVYTRIGDFPIVNGLSANAMIGDESGIINSDMDEGERWAYKTITNNTLYVDSNNYSTGTGAQLKLNPRIKNIVFKEKIVYNQLNIPIGGCFLMEVQGNSSTQPNECIFKWANSTPDSLVTLSSTVNFYNCNFCAGLGTITTIKGGGTAFNINYYNCNFTESNSGCIKVDGDYDIGTTESLGTKAPKVSFYNCTFTKTNSYGISFNINAYADLYFKDCTIKLNQEASDNFLREQNMKKVKFENCYIFAYGYIGGNKLFSSYKTLVPNYTLHDCYINLCGPSKLPIFMYYNCLINVQNNNNRTSSNLYDFLITPSGSMTTNQKQNLFVNCKLIKEDSNEI